MPSLRLFLLFALVQGAVAQFNASAAFCAIRASSLTVQSNQPVTFATSDVQINEANHFDAAHGFFDAPVDGIYKFNFHTVSNDGSKVSLDMFKNTYQGNYIISGTSNNEGTSNYPGNIAIQAIVQLFAGDQISVVAHTGTTAHLMGEHVTSFSGYLIAQM